MSVSISGTDHSRRHARFPAFFASVDLDVEDPCFVNWCNANAAVLFDLLGLPSGHGHGDLHGEAPLADVRRAIIRARATLGRRGPRLARPEVKAYGAPRALSDGTIELRPLRFLSIGLDADGMLSRIEAFERCVNALAERGPHTSPGADRALRGPPIQRAAAPGPRRHRHLPMEKNSQ